jgi:CRISPR-associated Csx14 family protein
MAKHVLITALGDHPTVVSAMVKALREFENIRIDALHLLYTQDPRWELEQREVKQIQQHLQDVCVVHPEPLAFPDPNTFDRSLSFLRRLARIMDRYRDREAYRLYLSVAGGRKNTAALMALATQFFPVQGLFHLIDKQEAKKYPTFPTKEDLKRMEPAGVAAAMDPPRRNMKLVPLPHPEPVAGAEVLQAYLRGELAGIDPSPIPLTPKAERFFRAILAPDPGEELKAPEELAGEAGERILLVPLGKTPMVATQTYTLLQERENVTVPAVAVLYPGRKSPIRNAANLLERQFSARGVPFHKMPIKRLRDLDSGQNAQIYLSELLAAIDRLRQTYPGHELALSLSGGRKGMSALALFAAQRKDVDRIYHTLITDRELEQRIEDETSLDALQRLATEAERAQRLFLDVYPRRAFTLFPIPIIPFA